MRGENLAHLLLLRVIEINEHRRFRGCPPVQVTVRDVNRYGRTVGEVILPDGRSLNRELVRTGLAWWYRQYARGDRELERLEATARTARRGLWADAHPVPPWEWRRVDRAGRLR